MEISYWWFFAIFWLTCGVIGYSMFMGKYGSLYENKDRPWLVLLHVVFGLYPVWVLYHEGWTEKDGMWL